MESPEALDAFGQGTVVGDHDGPRPLPVGAMLDDLDDGVVGRPTAGMSDRDRADVFADGGAVVRHAVEDERDADASRQHGTQSRDEDPRRRWPGAAGGPMEQVVAVDDQQADVVEWRAAAHAPTIRECC